MRELTKKQKELLTKWFKENGPTEQERICFGKTNRFRSVEDLSIEQWEELQKINDTEILYQNVNMFLYDLD